MSFRKEKKFRLSISDMFNLKEELFLGGMEELHEPRFVNSCYFDNYLLSMLHESEEGVLPRKKIRIRWYNEDSNFTKETKISSIEGRYKYTEKMNQINTVNELIKTSIYDQSYGYLLPTLIVSYRREYYTYKDLRITMDNSIKYADLRKDIHQDYTDDESVMEIKTSIETPDDYIEQVISQPTARFSKYSRGLLKADGML